MAGRKCSNCKNSKTGCRMINEVSALICHWYEVDDTDTSFLDFMEEVSEMLALRNEAQELRDDHYDYGAVPNCECGCGGDTFDWDAQEEAYEKADEKEEEADRIYNKLQKMWEER